MPSFDNRFRMRRAILAAAVFLVVLIAIVMVATGGRSTHAVPRVAIDNSSVRPRACLAYDASADNAERATASAVWLTMQRAGGKADLNVQQLQVPTGVNASRGYLEALVSRKCNLIITIGARLGAAAGAVGRDSSHQFLLLADDPTAAVGMMSVNGPMADLTASVATQMRSL